MLDALGILIGFVTAILVLSIVSTTLVQATSSILRLRGRNLYRGLERVLFTAAEACNVETGPLEEGKMDSKELVEKVCSSSGLLEIGRSWLGKAPRWLRGPSRTWIEKKELRDILDGVTELADQADFKNKVEELFERFEDVTKKRFGFFMRVVSIVWAVVIAVAFQVSAPDLLRKLSVDPELRETAAAEAGRIAGLRDVAAEALAELADEQEDPTIKAQIETVGSKGVGEEGPVVELRDALGGGEAAEPIVGRYVEILNDLHKANVDDSLAVLAKLDIALWNQGNEFYWTGSSWSTLDVRWDNVGGVLITAALLSLGAPFWFEMLKKLSGLRDALSPNQKTDGEGASPPTATVQVQVAGAGGAPVAVVPGAPAPAPPQEGDDAPPAQPGGGP
jgi:hypothetical protein